MTDLLKPVYARPPAAEPPSGLGLFAWWFITTVAFFVGAVATGAAGALISGRELLEFIEVDGTAVVVAYAFVHWTVAALIGGVSLGVPRRPTWSGLLDRFGWRPVGVGPLMATVLAVFGLALCLQATIDVLELSDYGSLAELRDQLNEAERWRWLILALILTFGPAFGEEIFFRGLLLRGFDSAGPRSWAIVGSSILFAVAHLDPVQSPATLILGLLIGWAVLRTNSLWVGIVAHAFNNAFATLLMLVDGTWPAELTMGVGGPFVLVGVVLLRRLPKSAKSTW